MGSLGAPHIWGELHLFLCRVNEREAALEETYRLLQQFPLDLEKFLAWLTEAETTANVLQDATHKERLLEDSKGVRELMKQWQVSRALLLSRSHESTQTNLNICPSNWYVGDTMFIWPDFFQHLGKKERGGGRGESHLLSLLTADLLNSMSLTRKNLHIKLELWSERNFAQRKKLGIGLLNQKSCHCWVFI